MRQFYLTNGYADFRVTLGCRRAHAGQEGLHHHLCGGGGASL